MIIPGQTLRKIRPVEPFCERTKFEGMTFGVGPAGYDVRIAEIRMMQPGQFRLASTIERFKMPNDVLGQVCDKSTWARLGIAVQNTIIEPGWEGFLTIEITNHSDGMRLINAGCPIAQIIFYRLEEGTNAPYRGKYHNQKAGAQPAILEK